MNQCLISGMPTNNKWKNIYIHPEVLDLAKDLIEDKNCPATTMRQAFSLIADNLQKTILTKNKLKELNNDESNGTKGH